MKFCMDHWNALRAAIDERGLTDLVAPDGQTAVAQLADQVDQGETPANYDPLMAAHWAIVNNISGLGRGVALYLLYPNEDGSDRCPLCYANEQHRMTCEDLECAFTYDGWIDRAADDQAERVAEMRAGGATP
jgi:hypothetical protein